MDYFIRTGWGKQNSQAGYREDDKKKTSLSPILSNIQRLSISPYWRSLGDFRIENNKKAESKKSSRWL